MLATELLKRPYSRVVVPESDGTFKGEILEFPGCIATAETAGEALSRLEEVAESWLESVLARGQSVPEPLEENDYSGKLMVRMPKGLHQRAAMWAEREGVSLNQFIVASVAEQVGARSAAVSSTGVFRASSQIAHIVIHDYRSSGYRLRPRSFSKDAALTNENQMLNVPFHRELINA